MDDLYDIVIIDNPNSNKDEEDIISLLEKEDNKLLDNNIENAFIIENASPIYKNIYKKKYSYRNKFWSKVNYIDKSIKNVSKKCKLRDLENFFGIVNNRLYIRK